MTTKRLDYMDYFRGIAILYILAGHTLCWGKSTMLDVNKFLLAGGTYFFVFIAGFLFQHLSYKFELWTYYKKKLINVICPSFIILLIPAYLCAFCNPHPDILKESSHIGQFFTYLICGYTINYPLWFIGMIVIFFMISPLILFIKRKNTTIYQTLVLSALILALITTKLHYQFNVAPISAFILTSFKIHLLNAIHFMFTYLLGIEMCDFITNHKNFLEKNLPKIFKMSLFLYIFHFIVQLLIYKSTSHFSFYTRTLSTFVILSGLLIMEDKIRNNKILDRTLKFFAEYSFGLFFIHFYIIYLIQYHTLYARWFVIPNINVYKNTLKCCLTSWGMFIVVLIGSVLFLVITKKVLQKLGVKNTRMFIGV